MGVSLSGYLKASVYQQNFQRGLTRRWQFSKAALNEHFPQGIISDEPVEMAGGVEFSFSSLEKHIFMTVDTLRIEMKVNVLKNKWIKLVFQK